jgi:hypothetical protein
MSTGIVRNGVIVRALGGNMRKSKRFRPRVLSFRSLLIVVGASMLLAAFVPRTNADVIAYFNFEDAAPGSAPDFTSESDQGLGIATTITTNYDPAHMTTTSDFTGGLNRVPGDIDNPPNGLSSLGLSRTIGNNGAFFDIPLFSPQGFFQDMTLTFVNANHGNGFALVTLQFSTNGGGTFTTGPSSPLLTGPPAIISLAVPVAANNAPLLVLRLVFSGGTSNGNDPQTQIDNILISGTIVPEPATVAGGLLGVLGLCWFQQRRLRLLLPRLRRA